MPPQHASSSSINMNFIPRSLFKELCLGLGEIKGSVFFARAVTHDEPRLTYRFISVFFPTRRNADDLSRSL